jgi:hypothetical protein
MPIRLLTLPNDLELLSEMAAETFQYPGHPEWSAQADEIESIAASIKNYRRVWLVIRLLQPYLGNRGLIEVRLCGNQ